MIPITPSNPERLALIGYNSLLTSSTEAPKALIPNTFERYTPASGAVVAKFQLSTSATVNYIAIGAHNIGSHDDGTVVTISYATTIGGALTSIDSVTPSDNSALFFSFDSITMAEIAITTNATTSGLEIGVVYAGESLQMQQPIYGGVDPIDLASVTKYQSAMSDSGQFLGRNVIRQGLESTLKWQHLDDLWIRNTFKPFMQSAKTLPFFIKWRPDYYDSAVFGYTTSDIKPANMGGGSRLMTVSVDMRGHADI